MDSYDTIVIGAGHNGLICATYLARHGQRVLVLECSDTIGGLAATREFHPGFKASVAHSVSHFSGKIASDLDLDKQGFRAAAGPLRTIGLSPDGQHVVLDRGSVSGAGTGDADAYLAYARLMQRFADALKPFWLRTIPRIGTTRLAGIKTFAHIGLNLRRLGRDDMREFLRVVALPTRDLMDEYFENDLLKAMLSWDGLIGSKLAPRSPNNSVLMMLYRLAGEQRGGHVLPAGGVGGLIGALHASATGSGVEVRTGAAVSRVLVRGSADGLATTGVELSDGVRIGANRVVSSADPQRTFLDLVGAENLEIGFTNRIRRLRCDGYVAKLHLALRALPDFGGLRKPDGRMIIAPGLDTLEFAFDDAKYGECPEQPVMEIVLPTVHDASLAPPGQHVLSAHVMYVPYRLEGGWDEASRHALGERIIDTIARYAPGLREHIVGQELLTPADLERKAHVTGGHWHHTEFAMDQMLMMRPTYGAAQYATPVAGLYLCGAGCHPGGGLMGGPGHNAAREILK